MTGDRMGQRAFVSVLMAPWEGEMVRIRFAEPIPEEKLLDSTSSVPELWASAVDRDELVRGLCGWATSAGYDVAQAVDDHGVVLTLSAPES